MLGPVLAKLTAKVRPQKTQRTSFQGKGMQHCTGHWSAAAIQCEHVPANSVRAHFKPNQNHII